MGDVTANVLSWRIWYFEEMDELKYREKSWKYEDKMI